MNMFLATLGYLAFTTFLLFFLYLESTQKFIQADFWVFLLLYIFILIPLVCWMSLTYAYIAHLNGSLWLFDRLVLFIIGLASLGMLLALLKTQPRKPAWAFWLALIGAIFLVNQTALLDVFVWGNHFLV
jgi:uncharacterized membrane protein YuzA (DUF378 family)